ncbi:MAG: tyrosine-type recombinase/integrase [Gammaproteobacteria bacterium]|nr:tyrosine-type recombinase/integrase [Gammaproteobacteria bacterium]
MTAESSNSEYDLVNVVEQYCRQRPLRPATQQTYRSHAERFVRDTSVRRVDYITQEVLLEWRELIAERASRTTYNTYHRHLRALLNFCVEIELIDRNPILKIRQFRRVNVRGKGCTMEELQEVCDFLARDSRELSPLILNMVLTLFYTGMRRSQLCGLDWKDIDFQENTIMLRKQHSKTGREWAIPLHDELRPRLLEMKEDVMQHFPSFSESDQVFMIQRYSSYYRGARMAPEQLGQILRRTADRSGIRISAHRIRHLVATTLANKDTEDFHEKGTIPYTLNSIKDFLGHEDITTTIGYIESNVSSQRTIIKGLKMIKEPGKGE